MSSTLSGSQSNKRWGKLIVGAILLIIGLLIAREATDLICSPVTEEPPLPEGVTSDIDLLDSGQINEYQESFAILYDHEYRVTIYFKDMWSIKGLWSGAEAKLLIPASLGAVFTGKSKSDSWADTLHTHGTHSFSPYLEVSFVVGRECIHKWISAIAELDVVAPSPSSLGYFTNLRQHLQRQIEFFVVSPEERQMLIQHSEWAVHKEAKESLSGKIFTVLVAVLCFTGGALLICKALASRRF